MKTAKGIRDLLRKIKDKELKIREMEGEIIKLKDKNKRLIITISEIKLKTKTCSKCGQELSK